MPGGLESIALAVAHLEANSAAARFVKAPEEQTSESRTKTNTTAPLPTSRSKLSSTPISSSSPPSDSLSAASATLKHRTLPGRMGLTQAGRVVSADHSDHRVESCEDFTNEANAVRVTTLQDDLDCKVKVHNKVKLIYKNNKSKSQKTITTMSTPSKPQGMKDSTQDSESSVLKSRTFPTEEASREDASASPLSVDTADSASVKLMEDMLFDLDLRELKTLTGPEPAEVIPFVQPNDVLCGRGGETNHHAGNIQYRQFVKACQRAYIAAKRRDKPFIAKRVVLAVRKLGGRFLKKDQATNSWRDVGNTKAREKTSQALREGAPELRNEEPIADAAVVRLPSKRKECDSTSAVEHAALERCNNVDASANLGVAESSKKKKKKRRISLADSADFAVVPSSRMNMPTSLCQPCAPSNFLMMMPAIPPPTRFATTVSADDEERSTSSYEDAKRESSTGSMKAKGPRIKLFKQRLETETTI